MITPDSEIGGGTVIRPFTFGPDKLALGTKLTREQVLSIKRPNRNSLIENRFLRIHQISDNVLSSEPGTRFAVHQGRGKYDVIEGRKLNADPLTKEEAEALAGQTH